MLLYYKNKDRRATKLEVNYRSNSVMIEKTVVCLLWKSL